MSQMYKLSVKQWSPFVGCKFECIYCKSSFQRQLKRCVKLCRKCYNYEPHEHPERLDQRLPPTNYMEFIFTCACGDVAFARPEYFQKIADRMAVEKYTTFLLQSKGPWCFQKIKFSNNVILGTTYETNRWFNYKRCWEISKAPDPMDRIIALEKIKYNNRMITIEPILDFDTEVMLKDILYVKPVMVWIGYDSGGNNLPEPPIEKVRELIWELQNAGIVVLLKKMKFNSETKTERDRPLHCIE